MLHALMEMSQCDLLSYLDRLSASFFILFLPFQVSIKIHAFNNSKIERGLKCQRIVKSCSYVDTLYLQLLLKNVWEVRWPNG